MTTTDIAVLESQSRAERKLSALLLLEAEVDIAPAILGEFIRTNWSKISPLAHIIHGDVEKPAAPWFELAHAKADLAEALNIAVSLENLVQTVSRDTMEAHIVRLGKILRRLSSTSG